MIVFAVVQATEYADATTLEGFVQSLYVVGLDRLVSNVPMEAAELITESIGNTVQMPFSNQELRALFQNPAPTWLSKTSGIYFVYCLYHTQPKTPTVKIRVGIEHQAALLQTVEEFGSEDHGTDAIPILKKIYQDELMAPAGPSFPDVDLVKHSEGRRPLFRIPGAGASGLPYGLRGEDAALLREVRYHIDVCLRGLGTSDLEPLCEEYRQALQKVWKSHGMNADAEKEQHISKSTMRSLDSTTPKFVADLDIGHTVHEFCKLKEAQVRNVIASKKSRTVGGRRVEEVSQETEEGGKSESRRTQGAPLEPSTTEAIGRRRRTTITPRGLAAESGGKIPKGAREAIARDAARQKDMERRARPWADRMGLREKLGNMPSQVVYDSEEDMPGLPGVTSVWEDLAGPSTMVLDGTNGNEDESNEDLTEGNATVQGNAKTQSTQQRETS